MLVEEIWQVAEGFVEVPANLKAQLKECEDIFEIINNVDFVTLRTSYFCGILW